MTLWCSVKNWLQYYSAIILLRKFQFMEEIIAQDSYCFNMLLSKPTKFCLSNRFQKRVAYPALTANF